MPLYYQTSEDCRCYLVCCLARHLHAIHLDAKEEKMMARRRSSVRIGVTGLGQREELAPGVFINNHYRGCTPGFIHTDEGIILVDTPLIPKQALDWREQIEDEYPGEPFLYLI